MKLNNILLLFVVLYLCACSQNQQSEKVSSNKKATAKKDTIQKVVPKQTTPKDYNKIVVVGDAVADIVTNLVDTSKIVGIHKILPFATYLKKDKVGYGGFLKGEYIIKTNTEVVFSDKEGSPEKEMDIVKSKNIDYFTYTKPKNINETKKIIRDISTKLKLTTKGKGLINKIDSSLALIKKLRKGRKDSIKVLYVYAKGPYVTLTAGKGTPADEFIKLAGAKNAAEDYEGMTKLTKDEIVALNPSLILMSVESKLSLEGKTHQAEVLMSSPIYRMNIVYLLSEHEISNFGFRTANAASRLANKLYGSGY